MTHLQDQIVSIFKSIDDYHGDPYKKVRDFLWDYDMLGEESERAILGLLESKDSTVVRYTLQFISYHVRFASSHRYLADMADRVCGMDELVLRDFIAALGVLRVTGGLRLLRQLLSDDRAGALEDAVVVALASIDATESISHLGKLVDHLVATQMILDSFSVRSEPLFVVMWEIVRQLGERGFDLAASALEEEPLARTPRMDLVLDGLEAEIRRFYGENEMGSVLSRIERLHRRLQCSGTENTD